MPREQDMARILELRRQREAAAAARARAAAIARARAAAGSEGPRFEARAPAQDPRGPGEITPRPGVPGQIPPLAPQVPAIQEGRFARRDAILGRDAPAPAAPLLPPAPIAQAFSNLFNNFDRGETFTNAANALNPAQNTGSRANRAGTLAGTTSAGSQFQAIASGLQYGSLPQFNPADRILESLVSAPGGFFGGAAAEYRSGETGFMGLLEAGMEGAGEAVEGSLRESMGQRGSEVVTGREGGAPPAFGSEQARLGPVAQAEAFFHGSSGNRWELGAFYRGVNPEDRNPPVFISPFTYGILTGGIDEEFRVPPEFIERLYDQDPVTGYWVRKTGNEDLPIDAGYGGYGGYGGYPYYYPSYGGYGGGGYGGGRSSAPRAPSMGLVNWRI